MQSLREMQSGFAAALLAPGASLLGAPGVRARGISPALRIGFYRTSVFGNYRKALAATYPVTEQLVGTAFFGHLAHEYVERYPSRSGDVGQHGEQFAQFLSMHACSAELPYLSDVAWLEWNLEETFNEADSGPLELNRLAMIAEEHWQALRFMLAPACRLFSSAFPIDRIWQLCQPGADGSLQVKLTEGGVNLLIRRDGFAVMMERTSAAELTMLRMIQSGHRVGEAFEQARQAHVDFDLADFLRRHCTNGVLADFVLPAEVLET